MPETFNQFANKVDAARLLGYSDSQFDRYIKKGLPGIGHGRGRKFDIPSCVQWLINFQVSEAQQEFKDKAATGDDASWSTRKLAADALLKELELERERGVLVNINDAEKELARNLSAVRAALLSFSSRSSPYLMGITSEITMRETVDTEIEKLMLSIKSSLETKEIEEEEDADHLYPDAELAEQREAEDAE